MSILTPFSIIVAIDGGNGIAKMNDETQLGEIPWNSRSDMQFFRDTTMGRGKNVVIMGRVTYESIPPEFRPLPGRRCIVISRTWKQEDHPNISICNSLLEALKTVGGNIKNYDEVFITGGEQIYNEAISNFMYLCKKMYITKFKTDYDCDQFFPWTSVKDYPYFQDPQKTMDFVRHFIAPDIVHGEYEYLNSLRRIMEKGESRPDRTGIGTTSIFGMRMEYDISERLPVLTTKRVSTNNILRELLFFISGKTNTKILEEQKCNIWKGNTSREFLDSVGLDYEVGDLGAGYGYQWRHWGAEYDGMDKDYEGKGIDQLATLIKNIREEPHSRRHLLSAWNVSQMKDMSLPPCHLMCQFYVSGDRKYLDCQLYQRSYDGFLGAPYNITFYSILTCMIAHITNLKPRKFIHVTGDSHIYNNHGDQVRKQLGRTPHPFPVLKFRSAMKLKEIDDFAFDSFIIEGYSSWPTISAPMAL